MATKNKIDKNELKVYVTMHNNTRVMGSFYLESNQRLQDLMNDERVFLPLHVIGHGGKQYISMVSKRYIEKVEELRYGMEEKIEADDRRTGFDRRLNVDRRAQSAALEIVPLASASKAEIEAEGDEDP